MSHFLRKYQELVLFTAALIFTVFIIMYFVWGIRLLVTHFDSAFSTTPLTEEKSDFRSEEAQQILQKRGLL